MAELGRSDIFLCFSLGHVNIYFCGRQKEPAAYSWSAVFYELYSEAFPKSVHILGMPVLYQLMCMICGREGPGVEFKVRLISW